jgi:glycosyltransferase involved in cell wall biosynthesis
VALALPLRGSLDDFLGGALMRVCHVCNTHPVDDGRVFHRTCVGLAEAGYEVHLFAVSDRAEMYCERGVFIHPLPECQSRRRRFARRFRVAQMAAEVEPDLFHVHEPEVLGAVLKVAGSRPVIYDVHELYLDILQVRDWIPQLMKPLIGPAWDRWERRLVRRCAGVVVVTESIAQRYYRLHKKVAVVANYPPLTGIEDLPPVSRDGMTCVFAGLLTHHRGLSETLKALGILKGRGLAVPLALAGRIDSDEYFRSLWVEADRLGIKELVSYHGVLSQKEAFVFQQRASIGLVPYLPLPYCMASMANKLAECMALGLPVVFSDFPNYREVAGTSGAGIAVDPTKPDQIADAIEYLIRNPDVARQMGEAGRRAVRERFNWTVERAKLLELYRDILGVSGCCQKLP